MADSIRGHLGHFRAMLHPILEAASEGLVHRVRVDDTGLLRVEMLFHFVVVATLTVEMKPGWLPGVAGVCCFLNCLPDCGTVTTADSGARD